MQHWYFIGINRDGFYINPDLEALTTRDVFHA
jgi:hypothetical protein